MGEGKALPNALTPVSSPNSGKMLSFMCIRDSCISPQSTSTKQTHNFLECQKDRSSKLEDSTDHFQFTTGQSTDEALHAVLQDMKKFEDDLLDNLKNNRKVDNN